jgi:hypothetical protein
MKAFMTSSHGLAIAGVASSPEPEGIQKPMSGGRVSKEPGHDDYGNNKRDNGFHDVLPNVQQPPEAQAVPNPRALSS